MLSLRELQRSVRIIQEKISGATLRRVWQPEPQELVLVFEKSSIRTPLLISCKPEYARICLTETKEPTGSPGSFCEYARAHLPGSSLSGIDVPEQNRQAHLQLRKGSDEFVLIFSILGARTNLYLLDGRGNLVHSMRPLEDTRRELKIGEPWTNPHGAAPTDGGDRWVDVPDEKFLAALAEHYSQVERRRQAEQLARKIEQALKKEGGFLDRKGIHLQEDLGEAKKAETYRHIGELLKNVLHTIHPGDAMAQATDYGTGEVVAIPLDPKLSPAANLESYFARYQKESRGVKAIEQQIEELANARAELDAIALQLEEAAKGEFPELHLLESLAEEHRVRRLMQRYAPKRKAAVPSAKPSKKSEISSRLMPKRYRTQDGLEIWVGKSDEGNDYLSTRLARGNDVFFHLEGYPGSHVVLRTEGRPDPPPASVLDACELAVHFSKMKNAGRAEVHMAHIKDVKKPKGAKPGLVYVRSGRTVHLKRDPKRLQSILASRLD